MNRQRLYEAWHTYYSRRPAMAVRSVLERRVRWLERKMKRLARLPDRMYKGFDRRGLITALGMSLGIHKQLLWGLTSSSRGVKVKGGGGA